MTTYTYSGFVISENGNGDATGVEAVEISLTARWPMLYAYYIGADIDNTDLGGVSGVNFRVDGELVDTNAFGQIDAGLTRITWSGQTSIVFSLEWDGGSAVFQVDGAPLPVTDLASLQAFEALNPTFRQVTSGDYVPGEDPLLVSTFSSLVGLSQDDDFVNQRSGAAGNGRYRMREGNDTFTGSDSNEEVYGGIGNDSLYGNAGFDTIYGDDGDDLIAGGAQYDWLLGGLGKDTIFGGEGSDELEGGAGNDVLYGETGRDVLWGGLGNDNLFGGFGTDVLRGDEGNDKLDGGRGNDELTGGAGADQFVFRPLYGRDLITDFNVAEGDRLVLFNGLMGGATLSAATIISTYATDLGDATRFDFGNGDILTLLGVGTPTDLLGSIIVL